MKNEIKWMLVLVAFPLFMAACGGNDSSNNDWSAMTETSGAADYSEEKMYDETEAGYMDNQSSANLVQPVEEDLTLERKLIKNGHLTFQTDSLANRKAIIDQAVKDFGGYIEQENQYTSYDREEVVTTLRVPAIHFDAFLEAVSVGVGTFDDKSIGVDDVTEEFVDVEARIQTKKELKLRYIKLLDKAESITSIMEIEREMATLQAEIESYEGRLKYLSGSVKYATVTLNYYRMLDVPTHFDNKFENAFSNGWQALVWFFVALVSIWPFLVILIAVWLIIRFKIKKRKMKKTSA